MEGDATTVALWDLIASVAGHPGKPLEATGM